MVELYGLWALGLGRCYFARDEKARDLTKDKIARISRPEERLE